jgi:quercetin dioxygenase-like cupin family protein
MNVVRMTDIPKKPLQTPLFTGPDVTVQRLLPEGAEYNVNIVNFGTGVRNKFHIHECDQVLVVTAGKGIVATETEQKVVSVGDVIRFPAGEKHWHGATTDSAFSHIYISRAGSKTTQVEQ